MSNKRTRKAKHPKTIPTMAQAPSLFFLLCTPGDNAGAAPAQDARGDPHREFPVNEFIGNVCSLEGTDPLSLLFDTLNCCRLGRFSAEMDPVKELFCKYRVPNLFKLLMELGIGPVNLLKARFSLIRSGKLEKNDGRGPVN
jgi:hypothetical protein